MIPDDIFDFLRCPRCVAGANRHAGDDPGRLILVKDVWLVCQESDCGRKYPITGEIPDLRVDQGDRWAATPVDQLPVPPPAN